MSENPIKMYRSRPQLCQAAVLNHENGETMRNTLEHYGWPAKLDDSGLKIVTGENMVLAIPFGDFIVFAPDGQPYACDPASFIANFELIPG